MAVYSRTVLYSCMCMCVCVLCSPYSSALNGIDGVVVVVVVIVVVVVEKFG